MSLFIDENIKIVNLIKNSKNIGIFTHKMPDGDAIGSSIAVLNLIKKLGGSADFFIENNEQIISRFNFLNLEDKIKTIPSDKIYDLAILLDSSGENRIHKSFRPAFEKASSKVVIDHHIDNNVEADVIIRTPSFSSAGALVYYLFKDSGVEIDEMSAKAIYTAVATDTGGFMYGSNLTADHEISSELSTITNTNDLNNKLFNSRTRDDIEFFYKAIEKMRYYFDDKAVCLFFDNGYTREKSVYSVNTLKIPNFLLGIDGVEVSIVAIELADEVYHVSIRTKKLNAVNIAKKVDGGGHLRAAGTTLMGKKEDVAKRVLNAVKEEIETGIDTSEISEAKSMI